MIYALRCLCFSVIATTVLLLGSCDDGMEKITNSQPVIDRVIIPEEVNAGDKVKLEVVAHDVDGDTLSYTWEVTAGTVDSAGLWSVPSDATSANVLVFVSDGTNSPVTSPKSNVKIIKKVVTPPPPPPKGMVLIPAGEFQMGSNDPEAQSDEQPVHRVYVDAFFMDETEVTNVEYQKFVRANPRWGKRSIDGAFHDGGYLDHWNGDNYPIGKENHPVVYVSWYAAMAYAIWVEKRLPTEAEWEYAARGGLRGQKYPWRGDVIDRGRANYGNNIRDTTAVRRYPPNGYGLYDMAGNVWEWCLDEYDAGFYARSPRDNPLSGGPSVDWIISNFTGVKTSRVLRGGSWYLGPRGLRVARRGRSSPASTDSDSVFRCARSQ